MNLINYLIKLDIAILIAITGMILAEWHYDRERKKEREKEMIETAQRNARVDGTMDFYGDRLDKIEIWISTNSKIRDT